MTDGLNGSVITEGGIVAVVNGKIYNVDARNKALYDQVKKLLNEKNFGAIPEAVDRLGALTRKLEAADLGGQLVIRDRRVYLGDQRLVGYEITKLVELHDEGLPIQALANFAIRIRQNPSEPVRLRLYEFMEYGGLPLMEDGSFIAYKVVRHDYKDKYSATFNNSVGSEISMPREQVDDDDNRTCSRGLHVCSKEYIKHFLYSNNDRLMVVRVDPKDVVSIPTDYNNTKMRTAAYTVIGEIKAADDPEFFGKAVFVPKLPEEPEESEIVSSKSARDSSGRFVSKQVQTTGPKRDSKGRFIKNK